MKTIKKIRKKYKMDIEIITTVDYLFKQWKYENIPLYIPQKTQTFCVYGEDKEIFVECASRFTMIHVIDSIQLIKNMAKIIDLHESKEFINKLENLVHKYTNYINYITTTQLLPDYINFILINNKKLLNKNPYKSFNKILITKEPILDNKFSYIILNNKKELIIYKALEFIKIYCTEI